MYNFKELVPEVPTLDIAYWYDKVHNGVDTLTIKEEYLMPGFKAAGLDIYNFKTSSSNYQYADFSGTQFHNAAITGVNFEYAEFNGVNFDNCTFIATTFRTLDVIGMTGNATVFNITDFRESKFRKCQFVDCDFTSAIFFEVELEDCEFINCEFVGTTINTAIFRRCNLEGSFFSNILMTESKLIDTDPEKTRSYPFAKNILKSFIAEEEEEKIIDA